MAKPKHDVPGFVADELAKRVGPDSEVLEFAKRKRRVQQLIQNLRSSEPADRVHAVKQLAVIGADVEDAVPALSNALQDDNERVRLSAVVALGRIGADAKDAIPALINALQDDIDDVRSFALPSIVSIAKSLQDKEAVEAIEMLDEAQPAVREVDPAAAEEIRRAVNALRQVRKNLWSTRIAEFLDGRKSIR